MCRNSLQSDQNLRGPHIARQQQSGCTATDVDRWASRHAAPPAIDRYLLPAPELSSKPAARRCCCRSTGQTDRRVDGRTLDRFKMHTAYSGRPRSKLATDIAQKKIVYPDVKRNVTSQAVSCECMCADAEIRVQTACGTDTY